MFGQLHTQEYKATKKQKQLIRWGGMGERVRFKMDVSGQGGGRILDLDRQGDGGS